MRIREGGEKGREDEETDSTIVGAMGRKNGRKEGKEETTWFAKRRGKMGAARDGARGETKRG